MLHIFPFLLPLALIRVSKLCCCKVRGCPFSMSRGFGVISTPSPLCHIVSQNFDPPYKVCHNCQSPPPHLLLRKLKFVQISTSVLLVLLSYSITEQNFFLGTKFLGKFIGRGVCLLRSLDLEMSEKGEFSYDREKGH